MGIEDRKAREFHRREQDILDAAMALAGSEDWQSVTIDHIAERAEIGKGTVYTHFKSKDEVAARLVMDHGKALLHKLRAIDPDESYVPRFKRVLRTVWQHTLESPEVFALRSYCELTESSLNLSEPFASEFWAVKDQFVAFMRALVEDGMERGIIARQPIEFLMGSARASMMGALRLVSGADSFGMRENEAYREYLLDYILKGLINAQTPHFDA